MNQLSNDLISHLEGSFLDWDELNSRRRVLRLELEHRPWELVISNKGLMKSIKIIFKKGLNIFYFKKNHI